MRSMIGQPYKPTEPTWGWGKVLATVGTIVALAVTVQNVAVNPRTKPQKPTGVEQQNSGHFLNIHNYSPEGIDGRISLTGPDGLVQDFKLTYGMVGDRGGAYELVAQYNRCEARKDFDLAAMVTVNIVTADQKLPGKISRQGGGIMYNPGLSFPHLEAHTVYPVAIHPNCMQVK